MGMVLEGSWPALATPFKDGTVDETAYRELCEWQLASGSSGLVPCGTTGETAMLSPAEQLTCVRIAVAAGKKAGKPVFAGAGSFDTRKTVESVLAVREAGADGTLIVTPYYVRPTQAGLVAHFRAIAEAAKGFPILAYNVPGRTGVDLLPETYAALAEIPELVGVKEATASMLRIVEIREKVGDRFTLFSGDDFTIAPFCGLGGKGVISVSANVAPRLVADLVAASVAGRAREAADLQVKLQALHRALFLEPSPIPVKAALAMMGRFRDEVRLPLVPASAATRQKLAEALSALGVEVKP